MLKKIIYFFILLFIISFIFYINIINYKSILHLLKNLKLSDQTQITSAIISASSLILSFFSLIIIIFSYFSFKQAQKANEYKNAIKEIIEKEKENLKAFIITQMNFNYNFFAFNLKNTLKILNEYLNALPEEAPKGLENVLEHFDELQDSFDRFRDLFSINDDKVQKALFFFRNRGPCSRDTAIILRQFIQLRNKNYDFKKLIKLAKIIIEENEINCH